MPRIPNILGSKRGKVAALGVTVAFVGAGVAGWNYVTNKNSETVQDGVDVLESDQNISLAETVGEVSSGQNETAQESGVVENTQIPQENNTNNELRDCTIVGPDGNIYIVKVGKETPVQGHVCVGEYSLNNQTITVWLGNEKAVGDINLDGDRNDYVRMELAR